MMPSPAQDTYQIKLQHFEGPFDLLLFFIERDELDIRDIPIAHITQEFLDYIHKMQACNIPLASEFILFVAVLMKIKARTILPRQVASQEEEAPDPRMQIAEQLMRYKQYKELAVQMAQLEAQRALCLGRGNVGREWAAINKWQEEEAIGQSLSVYQITRAFESVLQKLKQQPQPQQHTVVRYAYVMEDIRKDLMARCLKASQPLFFQAVFEECENRIHALYVFLSVLELVQQGRIHLITGLGRNDFMIQSVAA